MEIKILKCKKVPCKIIKMVAGDLFEYQGHIFLVILFRFKGISDMQVDAMVLIPGTDQYKRGNTVTFDSSVEIQMLT
jgi:hypothetical protein